MKHSISHSILPPHVPHSRSHEGRFGRLFGRGFSKWLPPGTDEDERLAAVATYARTEMFGSAPPPDSATPVGYTYFGQFVDHDITFDPQSSLTKKNDPEGLQNFRSPRFDLDSVYGRGPSDQPYLYDATRLANGFAGFLKTGRGEASEKPEPDLQRNNDGVAVIGDPRNDENVIVSQLQLAFCLFHNEVLAALAAAQSAATVSGRELFDEAQRITTWIYQYVVWNDFIRRIVDPAIHASAIAITPPADGLPAKVTFGLKHVYDWSINPFMPVEFSVAAYRFGHSMIRAEYQLNITKQGGQIGPQLGLPIFAPAGSGVPDLRGGHPLRPQHSLQWDWYFRFASSGGPFPQKAHKIDRHLSQSVFAIPDGKNTNPLAELNIRRGWRMELPPATEVARALNIEPRPIEDPMEESLWVYILKEAEDAATSAGEHLGPVGSTLVAAVFSGLLRGDPQSHINRDPTWTPDREMIDDQSLFDAIGRTRASAELNPTEDWQVIDIIRLAGLPETGQQIRALLE